jgi:hypothetical protein
MMSTMVVELYDALRKAGIDEPTASAAARAVLPLEARTDLATKTDITELRLAMKADLAEVKADLLKWNVAAMAILTAIFAGIVRLT